MFDADILADVLTVDEIREELGYAPKEQVLEEERKRFRSQKALDFFIEEYGEDEDLENSNNLVLSKFYGYEKVCIIRFIVIYRNFI